MNQRVSEFVCMLVICTNLYRVCRIRGNTTIFYHETVNSDRYIRNILEPFFVQLTDDERQYGYFQEDSATVHMA
jgi:hypothetical protein